VRGPHLPNVGQTIATDIVLDRNNSNIRQFLSLLPDELRFSMDVDVNRNGNPALHDNFATDQSALAAYLDIEVPLTGTADRIWLQDTLPFNLQSVKIPENLERGVMRLIVSNEFPLDAQVQVLLQDAQGMVFDSLIFPEGTILAGRMNANGYVDQPTQTVLPVNFDQPKLVSWKQRAKQAIVRFYLYTSPVGQPVKLYSTYGIDIQLVGNITHHVGN
jgi:hypothetical protein